VAAGDNHIADRGVERVVYLVIMVVIAIAGIGRLWLIQRRHATSLQTVEGFRSSLERLSANSEASFVQSEPRPPRTPDQKDMPVYDPYREPLDPQRRAAAKRRLEARRRGSLRSDLRSR
jgi:hypothetical protein